MRFKLFGQDQQDSYSLMYQCNKSDVQSNAARHPISPLVTLYFWRAAELFRFEDANQTYRDIGGARSVAGEFLVLYAHSLPIPTGRKLPGSSSCVCLSAWHGIPITHLLRNLIIRKKMAGAPHR